MDKLQIILTGLYITNSDVKNRIDKFLGDK